MIVGVGEAILTDAGNTPVPSGIIVDLVEKVGSIDGKVDGIKERITNLESVPPHGCLKEDDLDELKRGATETKERVSGLTKWRSYLMGAVLIVGGAAVSFIVTASVSSATLEAHQEDIRGDVDSNKKGLKVLEKGLQQTNLNVVREVTSQGSKTRKAIKANGDNDDEGVVLRVTAKGLEKLRPYEKRALFRLGEEAGGKITP